MEGTPQDRTYSATDDDAEEIAQAKLERLLTDPDNKFLVEVSQNINLIENADSSQEALEIAEELILKRLERTFKFEPLYELDDFGTKSVNFMNIKDKLDRVKSSNRLVGAGGDATVVIAESDLEGLPPEICFKIAKTEETKRGRNSLPNEARIQQEVKQFSEEGLLGAIEIPTPYYVAEIGSTRVLAMEKLPAKSVDDIKRGLGSVPDWFDIDEFCAELKIFLDSLHGRGLYHRDMHIGNVMVRQSVQKPDDGKIGYVIDFGLSGYGQENMEPYKKETASQTFTYNDDYVIVSAVKSVLESARTKKIEG